MDITFLNDLRVAEIEQVIAWYGPHFAGKRVLEVGSGTGIQLDRLTPIVAEVTGLDLIDGTYAQSADPRVVTYDGHHIPFPDGRFDVVFSSNVLEHVAHREAFQAEIARVLAPGGRCIHVLPTHHWKLWTTVTTVGIAPLTLARFIAVSLRDRRWHLPRNPAQLLDLVIGERHGEFGTRLSEYGHFKPSTWADAFRRAGWRIEEMRPMELFYEGNMVLGRRLGMTRRARLARTLGSACEIFVLSRDQG